MSAKMPSIPMPPNTKALEHQVAGHFHAKSKSLLGALQDLNDGTVLKPLQASPNSAKELDFYNIINQDNDIVDHKGIKRFMPKFLGVFHFDGLQYLRLENICLPFRYPCVADIKIGRVTFGPDATLQKQIKEISKCPLALHLGFQTVGMKAYQPSLFQYIYHDRLCCRALLLPEIVHGLAWFFGARPQLHLSKKSTRVIGSVVERLRSIEQFFEKQRLYRMYAVSALIVYEGLVAAVGFSSCDQCATEADGTTDEKSGLVDGSMSDARPATAPLFDVRLIDFVHVYPNEDPTKADDNFLFGLKSLIEKLQVLLQPGFIPKQLPQLTACLDDDSTTCSLTQL